jgi:hypothetical protein
VPTQGAASISLFNSDKKRKNDVRRMLKAKLMIETASEYGGYIQKKEAPENAAIRYDLL